MGRIGVRTCGADKEYKSSVRKSERGTVSLIGTHSKNSWFFFEETERTTDLYSAMSPTTFADSNSYGS